MGSEDIWIQKSEGDIVKHIMAIIDIKKMILVKSGVYNIVNLNKEYSFCLKIMDDLVKKANKLYDHQMNTGKIKKFCCDFKVLEQTCDTYIVDK